MVPFHKVLQPKYCIAHACCVTSPSVTSSSLPGRGSRHMHSGCSDRNWPRVRHADNTTYFTQTVHHVYNLVPSVNDSLIIAAKRTNGVRHDVILRFTKIALIRVAHASKTLPQKPAGPWRTNMIQKAKTLNTHQYTGSNGNLRIFKITWWHTRCHKWDWRVRSCFTACKVSEPYRLRSVVRVTLMLRERYLTHCIYDHVSCMCLLSPLKQSSNYAYHLVWHSLRKQFCAFWPQTVFMGFVLFSQ
jgi:hypothetical protein